MKVGNLVTIVWTEGCETPPVIGIVTDIAWEDNEPWQMVSERQKVELFSNGKRHWYERGDLRVVA
jgi:hypothetical protein